MSKSNRFSPEVRERAVRMVQEHRREYPSRLRFTQCLGRRQDALLVRPL